MAVSLFPPIPDWMQSVVDRLPPVCFGVIDKFVQNSDFIGGFQIVVKSLPGIDQSIRPPECLMWNRERLPECWVPGTLVRLRLIYPHALSVKKSAMGFYEQEYGEIDGDWDFEPLIPELEQADIPFLVSA